MEQRIKDLVRSQAAMAGLDPSILLALVTVESGGDPWAWNPEPRYRYLWDVAHDRPFRPLTPSEIAAEVPPADFTALAGDADQEWWGQAASFGLCQIMGAVAREHGFKGRYLTALCDPEINLRFACMHLNGLMVWAGRDATRALAAYNGGKVGNAVAPYRNAAYAQKVMAAMEGQHD
jgi:hypothetical protein